MARRDLPPLRALTAFEAAARLGSFRMAAGELGITRSAVSHQIKLLEQRLDVQLFRRDARRAELTTHGQSYFPAVREAFDQIEAQTRALRPANTDKELTIQVYVTVALKWLIPRLHDFERRFPDVKVRLSTSYFDWNFDERNVDVGIILARTKLPGHYYRPLFKSYLVPVCSPKMKLTKPQDLANAKLIDVYTAEEDWHIWLEGAGVTGVKPANRLTVDSYILAQEAAVEGRGAAMTIGPYAAEEIKLGRLVQPFPLRVPHKHNWYFACSTANRNKNKIKRFEDWLVKQVAADPALEAIKE
ncbi:LysR substrate-binding domain-containing protein [Aestuariivirga litoralis]|uniref:LysR substrate-binding domain-containing protein n=1 Tax=Aestuariivirga litoralis TaxID=2650924 RepID=UPI0018C825A5|nr:LysR substrate-binding domain-containing protein [Aestuariivirga litoralis]MBG1231922.1 LysR family transcriptional regulator [Aestuariivirga litoralis]